VSIVSGVGDGERGIRASEKEKEQKVAGRRGRKPPRSASQVSPPPGGENGAGRGEGRVSARTFRSSSGGKSTSAKVFLYNAARRARGGGGGPATARNERI